MNDTTSSLAQIDWAEIILAASGSVLGILALLILAVSIVAIIFFRNSSEGAKVFAFALLFVGMSAFGYAVMEERRSTNAKPSDPALTELIEDEEPRELLEPTEKTEPQVVTIAVPPAEITETLIDGAPENAIDEPELTSSCLAPVESSIVARSQPVELYRAKYLDFYLENEANAACETLKDEVLEHALKICSPSIDEKTVGEPRLSDIQPLPCNCDDHARSGKVQCEKGIRATCDYRIARRYELQPC